MQPDYPTEFPKGATEGEKEMVSEYVAGVVQKAASLIEGKFMDSFEVMFETCGRTFKISMEEIKT